MFAFAFTLLVIGFAVPQLEKATDATLRDALLRLWPNLIAYGLSAGVVGIMWHNHQALYRLVDRIDRTSNFWNLMLLAGTAFVPFATQVLGNYPLLRPSTFLYGATLSFCSTAYNIMLNHLVRSKAFNSRVSAGAIAGTVRAYRVGWITYMLAMLIGLIAPVVSFAAYIGITLYYVIPHGVDRDAVA